MSGSIVTQRYRVKRRSRSEGWDHLILRPENLLERLVGIEFDGAGNGEEFDDADAALSALQQGHPLLLFAQAVSDIDLAQTGGYPLGPDQRDQGAVLFCPNDLHRRVHGGFSIIEQKGLSR